MRYANRRKAKYFGLIFLTSLTVIGIAFYAVYQYEKAQLHYEVSILKLHETEAVAADIQYSFKLQVQEWKNILLRGADPTLYDQYHNAFINQFIATQSKTDKLLAYIQDNHQIKELVKEFLYIHKSVLSDYQQALVVLKNNDFNAQKADELVRGIDRKPDLLLSTLQQYLNSQTEVKSNLITQNYLALKNTFATGFIVLQGILCILIVRLTGRLLNTNLLDATTGLGNRNLFMESIKDTIKDKQSALIVMIDIDDFKIINETCGNVGGDIYVKQLGQMCTKLLNEDDIICRLGGDLLGLVLLQNERESSSQLATINHHINQFVFEYNDISLNLSCSCSSIWIDDSENTSTQTIVNCLSAGLHIAKDKGGQNILRYEHDNKEISWLKQQLSMVHKISQILDAKKAVLFKQAITPIQQTSLDTHYELLLRIENDQNGYDSPFLFLDTAERFNLITRVDRYVMNSLVEYLLKNPDDKTNFSINLSGQTMSDPNFVSFIKKLFSSASIPTERLSFEITETEVIKNFATALSIISCLTDYRCKIYLDDFGTGMSSYAYIAKLGIDAIKVDGTFIKGINESKHNQSIVRSIVNLAKELNIKTVAEFVETEEELNELKKLKIDYGQGYLLHKPCLFYKPNC